VNFIGISLLKRAPFAMPHQFAFELKYLKKKTTLKEIANKEKEAEAQLKNYMETAELETLQNLRAWIVVIAGADLKVLRQV
jgi:hypothetical protein